MVYRAKYFPNPSAYPAGSASSSRYAAPPKPPGAAETILPRLDDELLAGIDGVRGGDAVLRGDVLPVHAKIRADLGEDIAALDRVGLGGRGSELRVDLLLNLVVACAHGALAGLAVAPLAIDDLLRER